MSPLDAREKYRHCSLPKIGCANEKEASMTMIPELEIYICGACRPKDADPDDPGRPGADLAADLGQKLQAQGLEQKYSLKMMQCMSVCKRPATLSIVSPGKFTFTIGDLDPQTAADDIITFAKLYAISEDGIPAWGDRPIAIREGVISRTPSFNAAHQRITETD